MSSMQPSRSDKTKKFAALNINSLFTGKSADNKKTQSNRHGAGLQSLGKVGHVKRVPPPVVLPSLRSEHKGNDPNVALVPSGSVSSQTGAGNFAGGSSAVGGGGTAPGWGVHKEAHPHSMMQQHQQHQPMYQSALQHSGQRMNHAMLAGDSASTVPGGSGPVQVAGATAATGNTTSTAVAAAQSIQQQQHHVHGMPGAHPAAAYAAVGQPGTSGGGNSGGAGGGGGGGGPKSWSAVTVGMGPDRPRITSQTPYFAEEFPSLRSGGEAKGGQTGPTSSGGDALEPDPATVPTFKPQNVGSWKEGGGAIPRGGSSSTTTPSSTSMGQHQASSGGSSSSGTLVGSSSSATGPEDPRGVPIHPGGPPPPGSGPHPVMPPGAAMMVGFMPPPPPPGPHGVPMVPPPGAPPYMYGPPPPHGRFGAPPPPSGAYSPGGMMPPPRYPYDGYRGIPPQAGQMPRQPPGNPRRDPADYGAGSGGGGGSQQQTAGGPDDSFDDGRKEWALAQDDIDYNEKIVFDEDDKVPDSDGMLARSAPDPSGGSEIRHVPTSRSRGPGGGGGASHYDGPPPRFADRSLNQSYPPQQHGHHQQQQQQRYMYGPPPPQPHHSGGRYPPHAAPPQRHQPQPHQSLQHQPPPPPEELDDDIWIQRQEEQRSSVNEAVKKARHLRGDSSYASGRDPQQGYSQQASDADRGGYYGQYDPRDNRSYNRGVNFHQPHSYEFEGPESYGADRHYEEYSRGVRRSDSFDHGGYYSSRGGSRRHQPDNYDDRYYDSRPQHRRPTSRDGYHGYADRERHSSTEYYDGGGGGRAYEQVPRDQARAPIDRPTSADGRPETQYGDDYERYPRHERHDSDRRLWTPPDNKQHRRSGESGREHRTSSTIADEESTAKAVPAWQKEDRASELRDRSDSQHSSASGRRDVKSEKQPEEYEDELSITDKKLSEFDRPKHAPVPRSQTEPSALPPSRFTSLKRGGVTTETTDQNKTDDAAGDDKKTDRGGKSTRDRGKQQDKAAKQPQKPPENAWKKPLYGEKKPQKQPAEDKTAPSKSQKNQRRQPQQYYEDDYGMWEMSYSQTGRGRGGYAAGAGAGRTRSASTGRGRGRGSVEYSRGVRGSSYRTSSRGRGYSAYHEESTGRYATRGSKRGSRSTSAAKGKGRGQSERRAKEASATEKIVSENEGDDEEEPTEHEADNVELKDPGFTKSHETPVRADDKADGAEAVDEDTTPVNQFEKKEVLEDETVLPDNESDEENLDDTADTLVDKTDADETTAAGTGTTASEDGQSKQNNDAAAAASAASKNRKEKPRGRGRSRGQPSRKYPQQQEYGYYDERGWARGKMRYRQQQDMYYYGDWYADPRDYYGSSGGRSVSGSRGGRSGTRGARDQRRYNSAPRGGGGGSSSQSKRYDEAAANESGSKAYSEVPSEERGTSSSRGGGRSSKRGSSRSRGGRVPGRYTEGRSRHAADGISRDKRDGRLGPGGAGSGAGTTGSGAAGGSKNSPTRDSAADLGDPEEEWATASESGDVAADRSSTQTDSASDGRRSADSAERGLRPRPGRGRGRGFSRGRGGGRRGGDPDDRSSPSSKANGSVVSDGGRVLTTYRLDKVEHDKPDAIRHAISSAGSLSKKENEKAQKPSLSDQFDLSNIAKVVIIDKGIDPQQQESFTDDDLSDFQLVTKKNKKRLVGLERASDIGRKDQEQPPLSLVKPLTGILPTDMKSLASVTRNSKLPPRLIAKQRQVEQQQQQSLGAKLTIDTWSGAGNESIAGGQDTAPNTQPGASGMPKIETWSNEMAKDIPGQVMQQQIPSAAPGRIDTWNNTMAVGINESPTSPALPPSVSVAAGIPAPLVQASPDSEGCWDQTQQSTAGLAPNAHLIVETSGKPLADPHAVDSGVDVNGPLNSGDSSLRSSPETKISTTTTVSVNALAHLPLQTSYPSAVTQHSTVSPAEIQKQQQQQQEAVASSTASSSGREWLTYKPIEVPGPFHQGKPGTSSESPPAFQFGFDSAADVDAVTQTVMPKELDNVLAPDTVLRGPEAQVNPVTSTDNFGMPQYAPDSDYADIQRSLDIFSSTGTYDNRNLRAGSAGLPTASGTSPLMTEDSTVPVSGYDHFRVLQMASAGTMDEQAGSIVVPVASEQQAPTDGQFPSSLAPAFGQQETGVGSAFANMSATFSSSEHKVFDESSFGTLTSSVMQPQSLLNPLGSTISQSYQGSQYLSQQTAQPQYPQYSGLGSQSAQPYAATVSLTQTPPRQQYGTTNQYTAGGVTYRPANGTTLQDSTQQQTSGAAAMSCDIYGAASSWNQPASTNQMFPGLSNLDAFRGAIQATATPAASTIYIQPTAITTTAQSSAFQPSSGLIKTNTGSAPKHTALGGNLQYGTPTAMGGLSTIIVPAYDPNSAALAAQPSSQQSTVEQSLLQNVRPNSFSTMAVQPTAGTQQPLTGYLPTQQMTVPFGTTLGTMPSPAIALPQLLPTQQQPSTATLQTLAAPWGAAAPQAKLSPAALYPSNTGWRNVPSAPDVNNKPSYIGLEAYSSFSTASAAAASTTSSLFSAPQPSSTSYSKAAPPTSNSPSIDDSNSSSMFGAVYREFSNSALTTPSSTSISSNFTGYSQQSGSKSKPSLLGQAPPLMAGFHGGNALKPFQPQSEYDKSDTKKGEHDSHIRRGSDGSMKSPSKPPGGPPAKKPLLGSAPTADGHRPPLLGRGSGVPPPRLSSGRGSGNSSGGPKGAHHHHRGAGSGTGGSVRIPGRGTPGRFQQNRQSSPGVTDEKPVGGLLPDVPAFPQEWAGSNAVKHTDKKIPRRSSVDNADSSPAISAQPKPSKKFAQFTTQITPEEKAKQRAALINETKNFLTSQGGRNDVKADKDPNSSSAWLPISADTTETSTASWLNNTATSLSTHWSNETSLGTAWPTSISSAVTAGWEHSLSDGNISNVAWGTEVKPALTDVAEPIETTENVVADVKDDEDTAEVGTEKVRLGTDEISAPSDDDTSAVTVPQGASSESDTAQIVDASNEICTDETELRPGDVSDGVVDDKGQTGTETTVELEGQAEAKTMVELEGAAETKPTGELEGQSEAETFVDLEGEAETKTMVDLEEQSGTKTMVELEEQSQAKTMVEPVVHVTTEDNTAVNLNGSQTELPVAADADAVVDNDDDDVGVEASIEASESNDDTGGQDRKPDWEQESSGVESADTDETARNTEATDQLSAGIDALVVGDNEVQAVEETSVSTVTLPETNEAAPEQSTESI